MSADKIPYVDVWKDKIVRFKEDCSTLGGTRFSKDENLRVQFSLPDRKKGQIILYLQAEKQCSCCGQTKDIGHVTVDKIRAVNND
jgi:hypothetical protein